MFPPYCLFIQSFIYINVLTYTQAYNLIMLLFFSQILGWLLCVPWPSLILLLFECILTFCTARCSRSIWVGSVPAVEPVISQINSGSVTKEWHLESNLGIGYACCYWHVINSRFSQQMELVIYLCRLTHVCINICNCFCI